MSQKTIILFEDELAQSRRFLPLTYMRPMADIRAGVLTPLERVRLCLQDAAVYVHARPSLSGILAERSLAATELPEQGDYLLLNSRVLLSTDILEMLGAAEVQCSFRSKDGSHLFSAHSSLNSELQNALRSGAPIAPEMIACEREETLEPVIFSSIWNIVHKNAAAIESDVKLLGQMGALPPNLGDLQGRCFVERAADIYVDPSVEIGLGTVLDASDGPIVIEAGVRIYPHATIMGPTVIGPDSVIKAGAKIYGATTIGAVSKIGGEVENSIILSYSNKQHEGYLGHSYLARWVNLGADTNTSDLKNDYSQVKLTIEGETFDTGSLFVGLFMGDHSKSAINSQFNTGTVVGVSSNIFGGDFPPKWIPSFSWGGATGFVPYKIEKALHVARTVMQRRSMALTPAEEALMRRLAEGEG